MVQYMKDHGMGDDFSKLQQEYETKLLALAEAAMPGRQFVMYQEVFDEVI